MINITKGNDFKLIATFTRDGEAYKFDSVSAVNFFYGQDKKTPAEIEYSDGSLTIKGSHKMPAGTYGVEVIGKEGDYVRRTAYKNVVAITNNTTAGSYDPVDDIDDYDIGMSVKLDLSVEKKADETSSSSSESGTSASSGDTSTSSDASASSGTESEGTSSDSQG